MICFPESSLNFEHNIMGEISYWFICMIYLWAYICRSARCINHFWLESKESGAGEMVCCHTHECSKLLKPNCVGLRQCLSTSHFLNSWLSNQYFAIIVTVLECSTAFFFPSFNHPMKRLRCTLAIYGSRDWSAILSGGQGAPPRSLLLWY